MKLYQFLNFSSGKICAIKKKQLSTRPVTVPWPLFGPSFQNFVNFFFSIRDAYGKNFSFIAYFFQWVLLTRFKSKPFLLWSYRPWILKFLAGGSGTLWVGLNFFFLKIHTNVLEHPLNRCGEFDKDITFQFGDIKL